MNDIDKSLWIAVLRDDAEGIVRAADEGASLDRRVGEIQLSSTMRTVQMAKERGGPLRDYLMRSFGEPPRTSGDYTEDAWTPLMAAVHYGLRESVRALLAVGADPNSAADSGLTPLLIAVRNGDLPSAEALLDAGADSNQAMPFVEHHTNGHSPLVRAAGDGNLALVQLLVTKGAELNGRDSVGRTALLAACARAAGNGLFWTDMDERMDASRHRPAFPSPEETAEMLAASKEEDERREYDEVAEYLIEFGADIDAETPARRDGMSFIGEASGTPLLQAALHGNERLVALLLEKGAKPRPSVGTTPLLAAVQFGKEMAVVRSLLEAGARWDELDAQEDNALDYVVRAGNRELIPVLEEFGATLDYRRPKSGATLLHSAAAQGQTETVRFLLDRGLEIDATCSLQSPADRAAEQKKRREGMNESLSDVGLALPMPDPDAESSVRPTGVTPLMLAAAANKPETVVQLLERGAYPKARDSEGKTARDYARRSEETEARKRGILTARAPSVETPEIADVIAKMPTTESSETLKKQLEDMAQGFSAMMNRHFDQGRAAREATLALLPE